MATWSSLVRSESDPLLDPVSLHLRSSCFLLLLPHPHILASLFLPPTSSHLLPLFLSSTGWAGPIPDFSLSPSFHSRISTVQTQPRAEEHRPVPELRWFCWFCCRNTSRNTPGTPELPSTPKRPEPAASRWTRSTNQKQAQPVQVHNPSGSLW